MCIVGNTIQHKNEDIYEPKGVLLPPLNLIYSQAVLMLNIVVYQMLIVTNVPVNSAALLQCVQCVTLL